MMLTTNTTWGRCVC